MATNVLSNSDVSVDIPAPTTPRQRGPRDGFLDALRAVAIIRVVLWHAFGNPAISWIIATMPLMFFVAGSLLHGSLSARPAAQVLRSRLKRLLVPFWFFGAIVLGFLSIVHLTNPGLTTALAHDQLLAWIMPLVNPTASGWEAGWASSPLWYIRAYLWLLLLSPLLLAAWRKIGMALLPLPLAVMMVGEMLARRGEPGPNSSIWIIGDLGIYTFFVLLGFAHASGAFAKLTNRVLTEWLILAATATFVAWQFFPAEDGIVNHSYPALFTSGLAWIAVAFLVRPWLSRVPQIPILGGVLFWMTRRAMSIYLWHSPSIVGAYLIAASLNLDPTPTVVIGLLVPLVVLAVVLTGWIEDIAGGKPAELWPRQGANKVTVNDSLGNIVAPRYRRPAAAVLSGGVGALILMAAVVPTSVGAITNDTERTTTDSALALPPAPSGRPDPLASVQSDDDAPDGGLALPPAPSGRPDPQAAEADPTATVVGETGDATLSELTQAWLATSGISGVRVAVSMPNGDTLFAGSGADSSGSPMNVDAVSPVTSVTKTMTAAIVLQLADEGLLDLDAPLTSIPGAGDVPGGQQINIRQLLNHSSGIAPYQEAPGYDASAALDPVSAVQLSLATDLQWEPGSVAGYSNSGFLSLGRIIESVTGQDYETVVNERILKPYGLTATTIDSTPTGGWVGDSAGGIVSSLGDLAQWGTALYRDGLVMSAESLAQMTSIDAALYSGLGTFPVCPCRPLGDGTVEASSYGHNGGSVTMQYSESDGIVIAAGFSKSFWLGGFDQSDVYDFLSQVRESLAG